MRITREMGYVLTAVGVIFLTIVAAYAAECTI